jgi:3-oxosteroid 1-dehydrogenase
MNAFDEFFDFVVVGSGGGSMCAALVMRDAAKDVLILEKTSLVGGTTARSGGVMWIPNNPIMKRDGIEDSREKAAAYLDAVVGDHPDTPGASPVRRRTYLAEAPLMIAFLLDKGIRLTRARAWPDYYDDRPGGSVPGRTVVAEMFDARKLGDWAGKLRPGCFPGPAMVEEFMQLARMKRSWAGKVLLVKYATRILAAKLTGTKWQTAGAALQGRMLHAALQAGIEIRTESPVSEIIMANNAVTGVVTVKNGRSWRVGARLGVLVNAGGFAHNQAMRDIYQRGTSSKWSSAAPGDTGEMIQEMMRIGAAVAQMEEMVGNQATMAPGAENADVKPTAQSLTAAPHAILVDQTGVRYMNEGGSYMAYCKGMLERNKTVPAVPSWAIFDSEYISNYMLAGTLAGANKPKRWFDEGYLHQAGSIEELARELGMQPATLCETVTMFNGFVARNCDEQFGRGNRAYDNWLGDPFHKPSQTLGSIARPPFYAVPVVPGDVGTYGGVVTDEHARVLREDGTVIAGLYATGTSTASVMGRCYPGAGSSVGPSFVWGYVAAKHARGAN